VVAVYAWDYPALTGAVGYAPPAVVVPFETLQEDAESFLEAMLAAAEPEAEGLSVERAVAEGFASDVLLKTVAADDLLVVGSRGRGGFKGLLLGSVSQQCAQHAPCPVVIVRSAPPAA
jgi:nucleotide-binding universal stress UspA family protein